MQLLIRLKDNPRAVNNSKKRGDVVTVFPIEHNPSPMEKLPYFLVVDTDEKDCSKYLEYRLEEEALTIGMLKKQWDVDKTSLSVVSPYMDFIRKPTEVKTYEDINGVGIVVLSGYRIRPVEKKFRLDIDKLLEVEKQTLDVLTKADTFIELPVKTDQWISNV